MGVYALTILLAAFLLFQVQPLIAKIILPWFGGASSVWSTAMLFFQAALLGGYLYAHWLNERLSRRRQAIVHTALLAVSLLVLPLAPGWGMRLLWMGLAGCASTLLLAITAYLTQDVAAIPFLCVAPLSVYLLSFIICFEAPRAYERRVWLPLGAVALGFMGYMLSPEGPEYQVPATVALWTAGLLVCAMVCHGEIVRTKPHPRYLTGFYLMIALGGALGGAFVSLVAPNLFRAYWELPVGLLACAVLAAAMVAREHVGRRVAWIWRLVWVFVLAALGGYGAWVWRVGHRSLQGARLVERNFYGQLRVKEVSEGDLGVRRTLLHGAITHGEQILSEDYRRRPLTYYCTASGVGRLLRATEQGPPRRIGVVGLGCGTLAAYGRAGDVFRFYEINPLVPAIAGSQFSYLRDSAARVEIVLGDGRLMLEREPPQNFDVLVMDAFSGDSVPVHLITREAMRTYLRHLKPQGVLAAHISNKYLDLEPVLERAAAAFGRTALLVDYEEDDDDVECFSSTWVLVMGESARQRLSRAFSDARLLKPRPGFRPWTDDFSSIFGILK